MEGWNKPPSHAWHLSRRRCHREGLLCKWLTQPPEMQPDIQEDAIAPSAGQPAVAPSWSSESAGFYSKLDVFSTAEISNTNLMSGWRECRPRDRPHRHEDTHAAKLQSTSTDEPSRQHGLGRSAGFMWKAFSSAGAAEDVAIVDLRDGWRSHVSVSADWNAAEFIRLQISKVTHLQMESQETKHSLQVHTREKAPC